MISYETLRRRTVENLWSFHLSFPFLSFCRCFKIFLWPIIIIIIYIIFFFLDSPFLGPRRDHNCCWHMNIKPIKLEEITSWQRLGLGSPSVAGQCFVPVQSVENIFLIWYRVVNIVCVNLFCKFLIKKCQVIVPLVM